MDVAWLGDFAHLGINKPGTGEQMKHLFTTLAAALALAVGATTYAQQQPVMIIRNYVYAAEAERQRNQVFYRMAADAIRSIEES